MAIIRCGRRDRDMVGAVERRQRALLRHVRPACTCAAATTTTTCTTTVSSGCVLPESVTPAPPSATADVVDARRLLDRDGAVLFQCVDSAAAASLTEEEVVAHIAAVPLLLFGNRLVHALPPVCKRLGEGSGRERPGDLGVERNSPHMDTAFGSASNDYLILMHSKFAKTGGENYLLDGQALLESLAPNLRKAASTVPFEGVAQKEGAKNQYVGGEIQWRAPVFQILRNGRPWLLTPTGGGIRNVDGSGGLAAYLAAPAADCDPAEASQGNELVAALRERIELADPKAKRFMIEAGQALVVDNCAHTPCACTMPVAQVTAAHHCVEIVLTTAAIIIVVLQIACFMGESYLRGPATCGVSGFGQRAPLMTLLR